MIRAESYKPTKGMKEEAQRGLDWRKEFGRGGTAVGIARARDIVNNKNLPLKTVKRMHSYFSRHEVDKEAEGFRPGEDGYPSNGRIAWALWGGDPGQRWAKKIVEQEEKKDMSKNKDDNIFAVIGKSLIHGIGELLSNADIVTEVDEQEEPSQERAIEDVDEWDGSPSRWPDTESYCNSCLINVNEQAGNESPDEWVQEYCKLPVRNPGDSASTYVRQAIFAAVGGRGIGAVTRPEDVSADDWDRAIKAAAEEIIGAYDEMDELAPQAIYDIADIEYPEERADSMSVSNSRDISLGELGWMIVEKIWEVYPGAVTHDIFYSEDGDSIYALCSWDGKLWQVPVSIADNEPSVSDAVQINLRSKFRNRVVVRQQEDGQYRWTCLACTAILNRDGEIDTTMLFDDFVERIESGEEDYPDLDVLHFDGTDIGKADYIMRDGYILVVSGLFNDDKFGRAAAENMAKDDTGYWGASILYLPLDGELIEISKAKIPAYTKGIIRKVTILPEDRAAALFTTFLEGGKDAMKDKDKEVFARLLGNDFADEMEEQLDGINRQVDDEGYIARDTDDEQPDQSGVETTRNLDSLQYDEEVDTDVLEADAVSSLLERVANMEKLLDVFIEKTTTFAEDTRIRMARLEKAETERKAAWLADLPAYSRSTKQKPASLYRPSMKNTAEGDEQNLGDMPASERADAILAQKRAKMSNLRGG